jgi:hypothetical protein
VCNVYVELDLNFGGVGRQGGDESKKWRGMEKEKI